MKILEVNIEKSWRGGEKQTLLTTSYLHEQGIKTTLACYPNSPLFRDVSNNNIETFCIKNNWKLFVHLILNKNKYDIIHTHTAKSMLAIGLAKPFIHAKIVFSRRHYKSPSSFFSKWKYNQADCITTVSSYIKNNLINSNIHAPIRVIHDASIKISPDIQFIQSLKNQLPADKKIVATIAALEEEKNPFHTLDAVKELLKFRNDFIFLHFGNGSKKNEMIEYIQKNKLYNHYFLMGHINRIESIYTMFDGFVLYSKNEGFGSSVIDAFLNKIPVLTSDVGGLHELVKNRGILITGNNTALLIDGFIQLLDNKNHQQIEDAYIFATETLSNQKIQQQYLQLFYSLTN